MYMWKNLSVQISGLSEQKLSEKVPLCLVEASNVSVCSFLECLRH